MRLRSLAAIACIGLALITQLAAQVQQGTWTSEGSIPNASYYGVQVALGNGKVLSAGGTDGTNYFAAAQLYNLGTGTWTPTGRMTAARAEFAAVVLKNGKVLVEGGFSTGTAVLATAEIYDPSKGTWSLTGNLFVARYGHTATLLPNGEVLVTGGCSAAYCASITVVSEIYNPATNSWKQVASLNTARYGHAATLLNDKRVLVVGGANSSSLKSTEVYDPTANTWTNGPTSAAYRFQCTATALTTGKVLIAGGYVPYYAYNTAELYDPTANTLTKIANLNQGRYAHTATAIPINNTVVIAGGEAVRGCGRGGHCPYALNTAEIYDVLSGTFSYTKGNLTLARALHAATLMPTNDVLVTGGCTGYSYCNTPTSASEVYTPLTLSISSYSLTFGLEELQVSSPAQMVTVTNVSHLPVKFTSIAASKNFAQSNNCPTSSSSLAPGASCSISVTFQPTAVGALTGAVTLKDTSVGSPSQTVALTGTGAQYAITLTPNPLNLPSVVPGPGQSSTASATVTNDGSAPVNITSISITPADGTFTQTNNCPSTLAVQQTCTIAVTFTPPDSILYQETLKVFDNAPKSPHQLALQGTGID